MAEIMVLEVDHRDIEHGRDELRGLLQEDIDIPSFRPELINGRWRARYLNRSLNATPEQYRFMKEIIRIVSGLNDPTTQRAVYYTLRGAHPDWTYKGSLVDDEFYQQHYVSWLIEKLQLWTGMTMQSWGMRASARGYLAGDGQIRSSTGVGVSLRARPALGFDLVDEGAELRTYARKVVHFEKDAGMDNLIAGDFPRYVEAVFSTSQGQLTETANKFLNEAERLGMFLYSVHDGDVAGIQMQLLHGLSSKNNCYMPGDFYPQSVVPLGFYPSIGEALDLPSERVTTNETRLFKNLQQMARAKTHDNRFAVDLQPEVDTLVNEREKWEFQALNAIHERAPQIFITEGLRVHGDELKHVPPSQQVKEDIMSGIRQHAEGLVDDALDDAVTKTFDEIKQEVMNQVREQIEDEIESFTTEVEELVDELDEYHQQRFREYVKRIIVKNPRLYYHEAVGRAARELFSADFSIQAGILVHVEVPDDLQVDTSAEREDLPRRDPVTRTELVDAINAKVIRQARVRRRVQARIREALEQRFGPPSERW